MSPEQTRPWRSWSKMLGELFATQGAVNLQLSGGEPTAREDLPEVIEAACKAGFTFVQLNTNGLRLAGERDYAERLRSAGLASVFLQFDGVHDETYRVLRGRPLLDVKMRAIERCAAAGLAVVLVPTLVAGVNDQEVGRARADGRILAWDRARASLSARQLLRPLPARGTATSHPAPSASVTRGPDGGRGPCRRFRPELLRARSLLVSGALLGS